MKWEYLIVDYEMHRHLSSDLPHVAEQEAMNNEGSDAWEAFASFHWGERLMRVVYRRPAA